MYGGGIGRDRASRSELVAHTANKSLDARQPLTLPTSAVAVQERRHRGKTAADQAPTSSPAARSGRSRRRRSRRLRRPAGTGRRGGLRRRRLGRGIRLRVADHLELRTQPGTRPSRACAAVGGPGTATGTRRRARGSRRLGAGGRRGEHAGGRSRLSWSLASTHGVSPVTSSSVVGDRLAQWRPEPDPESPTAVSWSISPGSTPSFARKRRRWPGLELDAVEQALARAGSCPGRCPARAAARRERAAADHRPAPLPTGPADAAGARERGATASRSARLTAAACASPRTRRRAPISSPATPGMTGAPGPESRRRPRPRARQLGRRRRRGGRPASRPRPGSGRLARLVLVRVEHLDASSTGTRLRLERRRGSIASRTSHGPAGRSLATPGAAVCLPRIAERR